MIRIYVTGGGSDVYASLLVGAEALIDDQLVSPLTTFPVKPDDLLTEGAGFAGDRLTLRYRNANAASRTSSASSSTSGSCVTVHRTSSM